MLNSPKSPHIEPDKFYKSNPCNAYYTRFLGFKKLSDVLIFVTVDYGSLALSNSTVETLASDRQNSRGKNSKIEWLKYSLKAGYKLLKCASESALEGDRPTQSAEKGVSQW